MWAPGPRRMRSVFRSAWASSRSGAGIGSHGTVKCSPSQASVKPSESASSSVSTFQRFESASGLPGGWQGMRNNPTSTSAPFSLLRGVAAVDEDRLAGYEGGGVGDEPDDGV